MHSQFDCIVSGANYLGVTSSINVTKNVAASSTLGCFCFATRHCRMYVITRWQVREFWTMLSRDLKSRYTGSCLLAARRWFSWDATKSYVCLSYSSETSTCFRRNGNEPEAAVAWSSLDLSFISGLERFFANRLWLLWHVTFTCSFICREVGFRLDVGQTFTFLCIWRQSYFNLIILATTSPN